MHKDDVDNLPTTNYMFTVKVNSPNEGFTKCEAPGKLNSGAQSSATFGPPASTFELMVETDSD